MKSIWLTKENDVELREINEEYKPDADEVLVKVEYSGINPADIAHGPLGFNDYPAGYDVSGTIVEVGKDRVSSFKAGDRVTCFSPPQQTKKLAYGAHQDYHLCRHIVMKVPDSMPMQDAACIMVVTYTAADALINQLELPFDKKTKTPILIWGGSSAVGCAAIQLAKHMGLYPIITTASSKHHETLKSLGADACFDYRDSDVVAKIKAELKNHGNQPLSHVLDCVVKRDEPSSTVLCEQCCPNEGADAKFTAPLPAAASKYRSKWASTFACRFVDVELQIPHGPKMVHKARPEWQAEMDKAVKWCFENYGNGYCMPNVVVVKGAEEGMKKIRDSRNGKASLEKYVIQHPL